MLVLSIACNSGPDYDYYTREYHTVLPYVIETVIDQYLYIGDLYLDPYEYSNDNFYLIDSPAQLDSTFRYIDYMWENTPRLDTLFPEDGDLLLFDFLLCCSHELLEYSLESNQDTLRVILQMRHDLNFYNAKCQPCWFAIGVTSQ
ncbi:hypothetical protein DRQ25_14130 [Candidatus Fermentibacteria bacterium]|nr:MAG: hypothetical protein DRQ25_14130 [Candidatus Fermentibacteria bacterium]